MSDFKIVKLIDPIVVQTNGVNASILGNTAGTPAVVSSGTLFLAGGNNVTLSQSGNTISINGGAGGGGGGGVGIGAGTQTATSGTVNFVNSNGLTFGMTNSSQITGSYTVPTLTSLNYSNSNNVSFGIVGSTLTASASFPAQTNYVFSNSNGVSFGTNGSTVTATVATNYQSQGAYLTTARASNDAIGLNTAATNATFTANSSGFSFNGGAYLTTAQPVGAYLTTARASNDAIGLNTAQSNATFTANSSGFSFDGRGYAGTATSATNASVTLNSNGLAISVAAPGAAAENNWFNLAGNTAGNSTASGSTIQLIGGNNITLSGTNGSQIQIVAGGGGGGIANAAGTQTATSGTVLFNNGNNVTFGMSNSSVITASASFNQTVQPAVAQLNGSSGTLSFATGSSLSSSVNGSTITFGLASNITTALQSAGAYLTTARASTDAIGLNTAQTNVTWTVNSSGFSLNGAGYAGTGTTGTNATFTLNSNGLQLNAGAYLTTAMASNAGSNFVAATAAFAGTNASGTIGSNGVSVSVAAPGAAAENNWFNLLGANTAGNTTASGSTIGLSGVNVTLSGTNGSQIIVSAGVGGGGAQTFGQFIPWPGISQATSTMSYALNTLQVFPFVAEEAYTWDNIVMQGSMGTTSFSTTPVTNSTASTSQSGNVTAGMSLNMYIFSRGSGGYSTNFYTYKSTQITASTGVNWSQSNSNTTTGTQTMGSSVQLTYGIPSLTSNTSNSGGSTVTTWGISQISLTSSVSSTLATFPTGLSGSFTGTRLMAMPWAGSIVPGAYALGVQRSSATSGTNIAGNLTHYIVHSFTKADTAWGYLGQATNSWVQPQMPGFGTLSASYNPASSYVGSGASAGAFAFSNLVVYASAGGATITHGAPYIRFMSGFQF